MTDLNQLKQTMLALAYTADAADAVEGDGIKANIMAGEIANCVLNSVPVLKGQWKVVWGPRVYDFPVISHGHSNNTMLVVQNVENPNQYVVAIAGTDPKSWSDWLFEDFWVWKTFPWLYGNQASELKPEISAATSVGLVTLQGLAPVSGTPSQGVSVREFLGSVVDNNNDQVSVTVTGHSLGGALAPAFACWLNDTKSEWDKEGKSLMNAYAFAGATPGNGDFATWMNSQFQGNQLVRVSNTLDVVPHAWNHDTLLEIQHLYPSPYSFPWLLDPVVKGIANKLEPINYQFVGEGNQIQAIEGSIYDISPQPSTGLERFLAQVLKQHVDAYPDQLGLPELNDQIAACQKKFL